MGKQLLKKSFIGLALGASIFLGSYAVAQETSAPEISTYTQDRPAAVIDPTQPVFIIKLKSNPTTGYSWFLRDFNSELIQPVSRKFAPPDNPKLVGAPGFELWTFRLKPPAFLVPQQTLIRFVYTRPWESAESPTPVIFKIATADAAHK